MFNAFLITARRVTERGEQVEPASAFCFHSERLSIRVPGPTVKVRWERVTIQSGMDPLTLFFAACRHFLRRPDSKNHNVNEVFLP